eukprot:1160857-Pelagomonas_calceolata.AAC.9
MESERVVLCAILNPPLHTFLGCFVAVALVRVFASFCAPPLQWSHLGANLWCSALELGYKNPLQAFLIPYKQFCSFSRIIGTLAYESCTAQAIQSEPLPKLVEGEFLDIKEVELHQVCCVVKRHVLIGNT